jgi:hypothetical protein
MHVYFTVETTPTDLLIAEDMPNAAKIILHQKYLSQNIPSPNHVSLDDDSNANSSNNNVHQEGAHLLRTEAELHIDQYFKAKTALLQLEERLAGLQAKESSITFRDIEAIARDRGCILTKRQIDVSPLPSCSSLLHKLRPCQHMIWEIDEQLDEVVDLDELQLTYYRNIRDTTGNEPNSFFRLVEVSRATPWGVQSHDMT